MRGVIFVLWEHSRQYPTRPPPLSTGWTVAPETAAAILPRGRGASLRYAAICYGGKKAAAFVLLYLRAPHENCSSRRGDMNKPPQQHTPALQTDRHQQRQQNKNAVAIAPHSKPRSPATHPHRPPGGSPTPTDRTWPPPRSPKTARPRRKPPLCAQVLTAGCGC